MEDFNIWQMIANQGFPVVLLTMGVWWFNKKNTIQEEKIDKLHTQINSLHLEDKVRLVAIIERHADVMEKVATLFEKIMIHLKNEK